jgi:alcohol dehydrogenase
MTDPSGVTELRKFVAPEFIFGPGARHLAGRYARNLGTRRVLVVTDPGVMKAGWTGDVVKSLEDEGISWVTYSRVTPNPRAEEVMAGAEVYRRESCNALVAVGGGSPMDCAKGIGIVTSNQAHILDFEGVDEVPFPAPPLICIPTTAGSSADVSQFAIIADTQRKVKIAIVSKTVVPDVALIDPATAVTMDRVLTAHTGMDALVHAIEAYVSNAQSPITDVHALEAVRLVTANLAYAIEQPRNIKFRGLMMLGSLHAGLAFSNASLGAVHAMAHSLGGFLDFAHGQVNAILLPHVIDFNFEAAEERYLEVGKAMGLVNHDKQGIIAKVGSLLESAGVGLSLGELGLRRKDIPELARKALLDLCMVTNPRTPTQGDIEAIYEKAL